MKPFHYSTRRMALATASLLALALSHGPAAAQASPRTAFVQLFEWRWTDIARECESHLGPKGFAAVQISPPNEHHWISGPGYPWYMRYQPVSYSLDRSRSGTRAEFQDMVSRCNAVGVGIYADAVINHMSGSASGVSSAGRAWSRHHYPDLYGPQDFHTSGCQVNDYRNAWNVQNCELSALQDLDTSKPYVQEKISDYLVDLYNMGVKGFRVDAAKHIPAGDLNAIVNRVNSRVNGRPFWFLEVIGATGEGVQPQEYFGISGGEATVTEFRYGGEIHAKFAGTGKLADLKTFGESWGLMPNAKAVPFIDNHDKQRGHGGGGHYLTYHDGSTYDLANIFMLAWPYGYPVLTSSYAFDKNSAYGTSMGPPHRADGSTIGPWSAGATEPACFNRTDGGWVCEHRYRGIANMVGFRNASATNGQVTHWWDNGGNQIAFGRAERAFVVINHEGQAVSRTFKTGLAAGRYCDVISGEFNAGSCSGAVVDIDGDGQGVIHVAPHAAAAIHVNAKLAAAATATTVTFTETASTVMGQGLYLVGNIPALGDWSPARAVPLQLVSGTGFNVTTHQWRLQVKLPLSRTTQYKFIKKDASGNVQWESGSNRTLSTSANPTSLSVTSIWK